MSLPFLISVDASSTSSTSKGLNLKQVSYFGCVLLKSPNLAQALSFIDGNFASFEVCVDATAIESAGEVVDILNAGASIVFVSMNQLTQLCREQAVPSSRLVVSVTSSEEIAQLKGWIEEDKERREISVHSTVSLPIDVILSELDDNSLVKTVYRSSEDGTTQTDLLVNEQERVVSVIPSTSLTLGDEGNSAVKLLVTGAVPDSNTGLYATIVTDERGVALGLVWSSEKSISEALKTGTGVYQSRKRGLWYKGQSSGDIQELVRLGLDCDSDCLIFTVRQKGRG